MPEIAEIRRGHFDQPIDQLLTTEVGALDTIFARPFENDGASSGFAVDVVPCREGTHRRRGESPFCKCCLDTARRAGSGRKPGALEGKIVNRSDDSSRACPFANKEECRQSLFHDL